MECNNGCVRNYVCGDWAIVLDLAESAGTVHAYSRVGEHLAINDRTCFVEMFNYINAY